MRLFKVFATVSSLMMGLSGCAAPVHKTAGDAQASGTLPPLKGGGYYKDDGPGANPPANLASIPDALPKKEPLHRYANDPYRILGVTYTPDLSGKPYSQEGMASWYGRKFHDKDTASGEKYDMYAMTAAHRILPIPSYARVTNLENGHSIVVRINDRGPFHNDRLIDLSYTAAYKLDILKGVTRVRVDGITAEESLAQSNPLAEPVRLYKAQNEPVVEGTPLKPETLKASDPTPAPAIAGTTPTWLQLGAFSKRESAEAFVQRVNQSLGKDLPGLTQTESHGLIKIQAGPFNEAAEAERISRRLQSEFGLKPYKVQSGALLASTPATLPAPGLYLQVAAVSKTEAADVITAQLRSQALPGVHRLEANGLIKIQAGPFANAADADAAAKNLETLLGHKSFKVTH